jgi:hypothetical protein
MGNCPWVRVEVGRENMSKKSGSAITDKTVSSSLLTRTPLATYPKHAKSRVASLEIRVLWCDSGREEEGGCKLRLYDPKGGLTLAGNHFRPSTSLAAKPAGGAIFAPCLAQQTPPPSPAPRAGLT